MEFNLITVAIAAFLGALGSGFAGWWNTHEPFDGRKFIGNVWRAITAALALVAFSEATQLITARDLIMAFLTGAGIDVFGNRIQGGIANKGSLTVDDLALSLSKVKKELTDLKQARYGEE